MVKETWTSVLCKRFTPLIIGFLSGGPKKFKDIASACPNEKTRSLRLKELADEGIITTVSMRKDRRFFVYYTLTDKGKRISEEIERFKRVLNV